MIGYQEFGAGAENIKTSTGLSPEVINVEGGKVYSYSAEKLMSKGENNGAVNYASIEIPGGGEIDMLAILSPEHIPMDAIAVFVSDNGREIRWAKSDGVTNVGRGRNRSGELADHLVREVANKKLLGNVDSIIRQVENRVNVDEVQAAATFEYGMIRLENGGWKVDVYRVGSTRKIKEGVTKDGDCGVLETYYSNEAINGYHDFWDPSLSRKFVGSNGGGGEFLFRRFSNDEPLTITSATDGIKSIIEGRYANSGMVVEKWLKTAAVGKKIMDSIPWMKERGFLSRKDDVSLVSIHLPRTVK